MKQYQNVTEFTHRVNLQGLIPQLESKHIAVLMSGMNIQQTAKVSFSESGAGSIPMCHQPSCNSIDRTPESNAAKRGRRTMQRWWFEVKMAVGVNHDASQPWVTDVDSVHPCLCMPPQIKRMVGTLCDSARVGFVL